MIKLILEAKALDYTILAIVETSISSGIDLAKYSSKISVQSKIKWNQWLFSCASLNGPREGKNMLKIQSKHA